MAESLTEDQQRRRRQAAAELMPTTPYMKWLGIVFDHTAAAPLVSIAAAITRPNHDFEKGMRASTISMTINYVGAAKRSDLICQARTVRRRKELTFTEITATDADGDVVAHAVQTYRLGG